MSAPKLDTHLEHHDEFKRVYISKFFVEFVDALDFDTLRAEGILTYSDAPVIGARRASQGSIERCDLFLGIYGFQRNWSPSVQNTRDREYKLARGNARSILAFVHSDYLDNDSSAEGVFELLSQPPKENTKVVRFGSDGSLTKQVFREVRQFFANGARFATDEAEARRQTEAQARLQGEEDGRLRAEAETRQRTELEARIRAEIEAKLRAEEAERLESEAARGQTEPILAEEASSRVPLRQEADTKGTNVPIPLSPDVMLLLAEERDIVAAIHGSEGDRAPEEIELDALRVLVDRLEERGDFKEAVRVYDEMLSRFTLPLELRGAFDTKKRRVMERAGQAVPAGRKNSRASQRAMLTSSESLGPALESALHLALELRKTINCPMLLVSLFENRADPAAHAFLSSFGKTQEQLFRAVRTSRIVYTGGIVPTIDGRSLCTPAAMTALFAATDVALEKKANEVQPRHLFQALMNSTFAAPDPSIVREGWEGSLLSERNIRHELSWIETTLERDVMGWIRETLNAWDDETPITQSAVQARMVEDDLFVNPPTQRDSAAEKDLLGFEEYAEALVQIIRRPETRAPLVVGVYGPWGSGKSTFMGLVKSKLDAVGQPPETRQGRVGAFIERQLKRMRGLFRKGQRSLRVTTVNYDAWAYADAHKLWSGLVDKIAKELDAELTARDRIAYLINSQSRRLVAAVALGFIPVALFVLGYSGRQLPEWLSSLISPIGNKPWLNVPGWITTGVWALYAYFLQRRPLTDKVASLAAGFDSAPTAGLVSRIQDEFKTALQARIDPEKPKSVDTLRTDIRQRVERNELKIVVFIDELDRCPLEKIVEILEAIKLFLAEDIFIVLLGVDTRVAAEAIRLHYKEVHNPNLPREYLEKIVQLPLRVPTAAKPQIENYLKSFMTLPEDGIEGFEYNAEERARDGVRGQASPRGSEGITQSTPDERPGNFGEKSDGVRNAPNEDESQTTSESSADARTPYDVTALSRSATLPPMPDTRTEFDTMTSIAREFLDSNPRRIKRLLNTYRYVKILAARLPGSKVQTADWQRTMLYWLAFTMKWPTFMGETIEAAEQGNAKDLTDGFLVRRLQSGNERFQPDEGDIQEYLPLSAKEIVELHKLAPNFLIENPASDRKNELERKPVRGAPQEKIATTQSDSDTQMPQT